MTAIPVAAAQRWESERRILPAALTCALLGIFGAHRFYVGKPRTAALQLLTLGGLGLWMLSDLILILNGEFEDADRRRLVHWR